MNDEKLKSANFEARKFLRTVQEYLKRYEEEMKDISGSDTITEAMQGTRESGALRRSSMDLSRALTKLRSNAE